MSEEQSFRDLVSRLRAGDERAAEELVRRYEPTLRRTVRVRLRDPRLRRRFDSADVCQSVFRNFFVRAAAGQFDLGGPEQLLKLLATMARNNLANQALRERAECRDCRRTEPAGSDAGERLVGPEATPSRQVAARELLEEARRRLSAEERRLLELRQEGLEWAGVAAVVGGTPEALRKQLARALDRVARELGLDEVGHD